MNSVFIRQMRAEKLKARNKKAVLVPLGFLAFDFCGQYGRFRLWIPENFPTDI